MEVKEVLLIVIDVGSDLWPPAREELAQRIRERIFETTKIYGEITHSQGLCRNFITVVGEDDKKSSHETHIRVLLSPMYDDLKERFIAEIKRSCSEAGLTQADIKHRVAMDEHWFGSIGIPTK